MCVFDTNRPFGVWFSFLIWLFLFKKKSKLSAFFFFYFSAKSFQLKTFIFLIFSMWKFYFTSFVSVWFQMIRTHNIDVGGVRLMFYSHIYYYYYHYYFLTSTSLYSACQRCRPAPDDVFWWGWGCWGSHAEFPPTRALQLSVSPNERPLAVQPIK